MNISWGYFFLGNFANSWNLSSYTEVNLYSAVIWTVPQVHESIFRVSVKENGEE